MNEKELNFEKNRLSDTCGCIETEMHDLDNRLTEGIEAIDDATVEALTQQYLSRLKMLINIKDKPYFARVDFKPDGGRQDKLYIGKTTVLDEKGDAAVVDWRAPISTLYYEGRVGQAAYTCPDGDISGEIALKRQFEIESAKLLSYNDIDITFDEELLKPYLAVESSMRLKNIIATIQSEQNRIIRADMSKPLIVQGVAGSGKTTVALHRIAYLIYNYSKDIRPEEFLIIAPNTVFLDYISGILPDLGVENVRQQTYEALVQAVIGKKLKIEDPGEKLARILEETNPGCEIEASQYKSSLRFRDVIDSYLKDVEKTILPHEDYRAGKYILCPYNKLFELFTVDFTNLPFEKRIQMIKERLLKLTRDHSGRVIAEIDADRQRRIDELREKGLADEEFKKSKRKIYELDEEIVHDLVSGGKNTLKAYLKKIKLPSALQCYQALMTDEKQIKKYCASASENAVMIFVEKAAALSKNRVEYEDLAPLMHIHNCIYGTARELAAKHIVIDEAQDFSSFQFFAVREALGCGSMTIFGDIAQGIYWYRGTTDWNRVSDEIFGGSCGLLTLKKSYRSTVEIMTEANRVMAKLPGFENAAAVPVIRNGDPVRFVDKTSPEKIAEDMAKRIAGLREKGMKNIAVLCKTMKDCKAFAALLSKHITDYHILSGKEYHGGLSVVTSYLAKGLEFDAVLIADAQNYHENETDMKLLYVAMTRAMHYMDVYKVKDIQ